MQSGALFVLLLFVAVSSTSGQFETNITFSPNIVPHGEVVVINCAFNVPLESVGLISIELSVEEIIYEYQPDTGGVISEGYEDKIISDDVDEGFLRLEMIVEMVEDTAKYYCLLIDENFDSYLSSADLTVELPLLQVTIDPAFFRHGDRVTVRCEFVPLPNDIWDTVSLGTSSTSIVLLYSENRYPSAGKTTRRFGNDVGLGFYEMVTAKFSDSSVQGSFVVNYPVHSRTSVECSLTDFEGNRRETLISFNAFTNHYVTITPNPAVIGQEVEFHCSYGYYVDYINQINWYKDDDLIIDINRWGTSSTFYLDDILTSDEGEGYHSFTKIATADDEGRYGCFADTLVDSEVSTKYVNLTVVEMNDTTTVDTSQDMKEKVVLLPDTSAGLVDKEASNIKSMNIRKEAALKTKKALP